MGASPRVLIIAGELSGDRYAEQLGITLRSRCPEIEIVGVGGSNLAKVADTILLVLCIMNRLCKPSPTELSDAQ